MNTLVETIKKLIAKGEAQKALETLLKVNNLDEIINHQLLILSGQYYRWKVNNRLGITDDSSLNKIQLGILELIDEIESPKFESSFSIRKDFSKHEIEQISEEKNIEIEAIEIDKIDFNTSRDEAIELVFHSKYWKRKENVLVPKNFTINELISAFVMHYHLARVLVPFDYHKVEWLFIVNYREVKERDITLEEAGLRNGDNIIIKGQFTQYKIKMKNDLPEPEIEIFTIEEDCANDAYDYNEFDEENEQNNIE